jgi:5-methylthioadenosine/S-adenosylhomocysteine deaminase
VHQTPPADPYGTLVYASRATDVRATVVDGRVLVADGRLQEYDAGDVVRLAAIEARQLVERAGLV